uniref:Uncharacterized protein n=1 Tax=Coccolithus braarudii TaxID=221442 RepID=A0A7S0L4W0_9EUKA|mmetsp:Transcript_17717/g.38207  ORF Transcript_17717/g.38207 Transcript_17717/m.38207 type:complete len:206 (+) Transcript_17717:21-638(+)
MGLKDEEGEHGMGGGTIWARGPQLAYVSPYELSISAAIEACSEGNLASLKQAIEADPSLIDKERLDGTTPLMMAARASTGEPSCAGRLKCVELLIAKGAKVNECDHHGDSALTLACMSEKAGSTESCGVVKLLLAANADVMLQERHFQMTALHWAAHGGKLGIIKELSKSADFKMLKTVKDREGMTAKQRAQMAKYNADEAAALL